MPGRSGKAAIAMTRLPGAGEPCAARHPPLFHRGTRRRRTTRPDATPRAP